MALWTLGVRQIMLTVLEQPVDACNVLLGHARGTVDGCGSLCAHQILDRPANRSAGQVGQVPSDLLLLGCHHYVPDPPLRPSQPV